MDGARDRAGLGGGVLMCARTFIWPRPWTGVGIPCLRVEGENLSRGDVQRGPAGSRVLWPRTARGGCGWDNTTVARRERGTASSKGPEGQQQQRQQQHEDERWAAGEGGREMNARPMQPSKQ